MVMKILSKSWFDRKRFLDEFRKVVLLGTLTKDCALSYVLVYSDTLHLQEVSDGNISILPICAVPILSLLNNDDISLQIADLPADVPCSNQNSDLTLFEQVFENCSLLIRLAVMDCNNTIFYCLILDTVCEIKLRNRFDITSEANFFVFTTANTTIDNLEYKSSCLFPVRRENDCLIGSTRSNLTSELVNSRFDHLKES